jgi:hypothetical protein
MDGKLMKSEALCAQATRAAAEATTRDMSNTRFMLRNDDPLVEFVAL